MFLDEREVKIGCNTPDAEIHFSLNGTVPDRNSALYQRPFKINKTTTVKMIAYKGKQQSLESEADIIKAGMSKPVLMGILEPGLSFKYITGSFRMVNEFMKLEPLKSGIVPNFSIEPRESEQYFAFIYDGIIQIPKDGLYILYLATNDGGRLLIDGRLLINNDGLHPLAEIYKPVALKAGPHPVLVQYFQEGGGMGLKVSWQGPGFAKEEIPAKVLFHKKNG